MSDVDLSDDAVYRACLTWDVPSPRASKREGVHAFLRALRLHPLGPRDEEAPKRMSPLRRAAEGLRAELEGRTDDERGHYRTVARQPGMKGLLGLCLLAWMNDATERDFYRVENRLQGLAGRGSRDLIARVHCKLAGWAMDHGWRERAAAHYDSALHASSGDLKRRLQEIGNRFDRERFFYFDDRSHKDTTSYRWIAQHLHAATSKAVEDRLKASIRSPWTRTWTIGGGTVEGHEVQAAELQASWAGALWLLPGIQRIHAAMILEKSHEARDVARAVALWVRGNGDGAGRLIDAHEGYLTATAVSDLVESQLNYGESVERRETWVEVCQTLWDQLPDQLVDRILERFVPPIDGFDPYSLAAKELELFAFMLCRRQEVFPYVSKLGPVQLAQLTRLLPPPLLAHMDSTSAERLLVNSVEHLAELDAGWTSLGWTNLALIWRRLTAAKRHIWRDRLTDVLPSSALPEIAAAHIELPHEQQLEDALVEYGAMVREEVEQARKGTFTGWTTSPAVSLTRLNLGLERNVSEAVEALVLVATSEHTSNEQRYDALLGLRALAESNLVTVDQIRPTFRSISVSSFMTGDRAGDQRLDDMARAALRARVMVTDELNGTLLAGGRDPDGRVRQVAVASAGWLALEAADPSPARDAILLGALYDPEPGVQLAAVPAVWRGRFADVALQEVAINRLVEAWPQAHRKVRVAIAAQLGGYAGHVQARGTLRQFALADRSWQVRWNAAGGSRAEAS